MLICDNPCCTLSMGPRHHDEVRQGVIDTLLSLYLKDGLGQRGNFNLLESSRKTSNLVSNRVAKFGNKCFYVFDDEFLRKDLDSMYHES